MVHSQALNAKTRAYRFGFWAETLVVWWLRLQGYRILARRYKTKLGEIDIIARRKANLAMIEVKARKDDSTEVLTQQQQKRINAAAALFIAKYPAFAHDTIRFDVVIVRPWKLPQRIENAWQVN